MIACSEHKTYVISCFGCQWARAELAEERVRELESELDRRLIRGETLWDGLMAATVGYYRMERQLDRYKALTDTFDHERQFNHERAERAERERDEARERGRVAYNNVAVYQQMAEGMRQSGRELMAELVELRQALGEVMEVAFDGPSSPVSAKDYALWKRNIETRARAALGNPPPCKTCGGEGVIITEDEEERVTRSMAIDAGVPDMEGEVYRVKRGDYAPCPTCGGNPPAPRDECKDCGHVHDETIDVCGFVEEMGDPSPDNDILCVCENPPVLSEEVGQREWPCHIHNDAYCQICLPEEWDGLSEEERK